MTDKEQIMIDGCNVSECLFYQSNFEEDYDVKIKHFCSNWHNSCESANNSNCYFKQLARKEQECEQIKEKYEALKLENQEGYEIVAELKHECEELKKQDYENLKIIHDDFNQIRLLRAENTRYRKALDEIEDYCNKQISLTGDLPFRTTESDILDIINKAKEENE